MRGAARSLPAVRSGPPQKPVALGASPSLSLPGPERRPRPRSLQGPRTVATLVDWWQEPSRPDGSGSIGSFGRIKVKPDYGNCETFLKMGIPVEDALEWNWNPIWNAMEFWWNLNFMDFKIPENSKHWIKVRDYDIKFEIVTVKATSHGCLRARLKHAVISLVEEKWCRLKHN